MDVVILATDWDPGFWQQTRNAPFPGERLKWDVPVPCPAIGVYGKFKQPDLADKPPSFLIIQGVERNEKGPIFRTEHLGVVQGITSDQLRKELGLPRFRLIDRMNPDKVVGALQRLGVSIPERWTELLVHVIPPPGDEWLPPRFSLPESISNDLFEDRIAEMFRAIGYEVHQRGHRTSGRHPDGIALFREQYAIVYDAKNCYDYQLPAGDQRAMVEYVKNAREKFAVGDRKIDDLYFAFVARGFGASARQGISRVHSDLGDIHGVLLPLDVLQELVRLKLQKGPEFLVIPSLLFCDDVVRPDNLRQIVE